MNDKLQEAHSLYCKAYKICQRATGEGKDYIGFRRWKDSFRLIVSYDHCNGMSSARMGLSITDWAENVLYRLQECGFVYDLPLDEYFEKLHETGYGRVA